MSTMPGRLGVTAQKEDNSSLSENSSDGEYELQAIRPSVGVSNSSLMRRKRKNCCTNACMVAWLGICMAYVLLYAVNGLFTWALIEAALANTYDTLVTFGCVWIVFVLVFFSLVIIMSNRKLKERLDHQKALEAEELARRAGIKAALGEN